VNDKKAKTFNLPFATEFGKAATISRKKIALKTVQKQALRASNNIIGKHGDGSHAPLINF